MNSEDWNRAVFVVCGIVAVAVVYKILQVFLGRCRMNNMDAGSEMGEEPFQRSQFPGQAQSSPSDSMKPQPKNMPLMMNRKMRPDWDNREPCGMASHNGHCPARASFQHHCRQPSDAGRGLPSAGDAII